jgi:two-component SAPR family response regulator
LLQNPQGLTREQIGAQFWPDHSPEKLESAFRSTLYRLRRDLVRECVVFDNGLYRFNHSYPYWYDVEVFEEAIHKAETTSDEQQKITALEEALDLYRGNYLQVVYENWCTLEREHLRVQYQSVLEILANHYARHQSIPKAIEYFQRLLREDPYRESAHRELMRCYSMNGDRASAIRQYKTCAELFGNELGLDLTPETQALYHQIIQ